MSETAPEPRNMTRQQNSSSGGIKGTFTTRIGPLPMWVWLLIITGILIAWRIYSSRNSANQANQATGTDSTSASDVPQFVNQTYTTVTAPVQGPPGPAGPAAPEDEPPASRPSGPATRINPRPPVPGGRTPGMVTGIKATGSTRDSISAAWARVSGATSYLVRVTYQGKLVKQLTTHTPSATIKGLGPDHTYTVHVAAVGPGGTSSESNGPAIRTVR